MQESLLDKQPQGIVKNTRYFGHMDRVRDLLLWNEIDTIENEIIETRSKLKSTMKGKILKTKKKG